MEQLNAIIQSAITGALAAQVNTGSQSTHQARRPEPPSISLDCSEGRWSFLHQRMEDVRNTRQRFQKMHLLNYVTVAQRI